MRRLYRSHNPQVLTHALRIVIGSPGDTHLCPEGRPERAENDPIMWQIAILRQCQSDAQARCHGVKHHTEPIGRLHNARAPNRRLAHPPHPFVIMRILLDVKPMKGTTWSSLMFIVLFLVSVLVSGSATSSS